MVEYGHGVGEGTGAVGGVQGGPGGTGGSDDWGASIMGMAEDAVNTVVALPTEQLLLLAAVVLVGLFLLKRAF